MRTEKLEEIAKEVGLHINYTKTKAMTIGTNTAESIEINQQRVEVVKNFTYLGSVLDASGGSSVDIMNRLKKARSTFFNMRTICKSNIYSLRTKLKIFNCSVMSVLLYGAECWGINQADGDKLDAFQRKSLRTILGVFWPRKISNEELQERVPHRPVTSIIKERRWRWIGHVLRMKF